MKMQTFHETVRDMRSFAEMLIPYSFPIKTYQDEVDIACLKQRDILVDGVEVGILFSMSDQSQNSYAFRLESLQVFGRQFTFLPFDLVSKIARSFLGDEQLVLTEVIHSSTGHVDSTTRNIYVWTLYRDEDGKPCPPPYKKFEVVNYKGFNFVKINPNEISFF